jgi:hypothetical protein
MPEKIKIKKLKSPLYPQEFIKSAILDQAKKSNTQFLKRFYKTSFSKGRFSLVEELSTVFNFRQNWFCKNCKDVFNLKPTTRFKTLLEYNTVCNKCGSENTAHNDELSKAIIEKKSISELIIDAEKANNISINFNSKAKYYITIYNTSFLNNKKNNEYFILDDTDF